MNRVGIGDLLLLKVYSNHYKIEEEITISKGLIKKYRCDSDIYMNFLMYFIKKLFPTSKINIIDNDIGFLKPMPNMNNIHDYDLSSYFNLRKPDNLPEKYIVITTKFRMDATPIDVQMKIKENILNFSNNFKSKYAIVLEGERTISKNLEVNVHHTDTVYNELKNLEKNNQVIDLTQECLNLTSDSLEFEKSLNILNNSELCISFGVGGNYCLNLCFGNKMLCCISDSTYRNYNLNTINRDNYIIFKDELKLFEYLDNEYSV